VPGHLSAFGDTIAALDVPLTSGRIGRKVLLGVLSRGYEIAPGGRPACESLFEVF